MSQTELNTWNPRPVDLESSGVVKLMAALGVARYEDLLAVALADPKRYWSVVSDFCQICWDEVPQDYVDVSGGMPFPRWFPGGRLNWVNTALQWARIPHAASRLAVVGESEDGSVQALTYVELAQKVSEFSAGLAALGVERGSRVGLLMANGVEATVSLLAIASLGAIVVPLFSGFGDDAIVSRLSSAQAGVIIASTAFSRRGKRVNVDVSVRKAWTQLPTVKHVIWKKFADEDLQDPRDLDWNDVAASGEGHGLSPVAVDPNDPFMVIYTSGTTGKPKGVVHTHGGFPVKVSHDSVVHFDVKPGDVFCWPADMGWIAGAKVLSCALLRGATLICYDGAPDFPDWSRMSRLIERHKVTHYGSSPTLIRALASNEAAALEGDLSSLHLIITAGESISPEHFNWFQKTFGGGTLPLINYTGGTEASGALLSSVVVRPISPSGFNSASPGVDVDVIDPAGQSLTEVIGEVAVRKPFVGMTQSFWQDKERYLDTYWSSVPDVWVHGDLALRKADGSFLMMGRSDDTIKLAGKRLGPAEVEDVVLEIAEITEAAAIGVDDADKGQKLVVFVVLKPGVAVDEDQLQSRVKAHVDKRLGRPFRPSAVHAVTQLPKNRSGKIMRRLIRSVYCDLPMGDLSSLDNAAMLDSIRAAIPATA